MKILSMTATFGKLSHETMTLQPGLNIIEAPNEWGKSTWCAFIEAMLYGVDTRERSTQASLAVKERFAPWSGAPMSGRMDIQWNGRYITIERNTKGKVPFGEFSAYETETGLNVPELTAANCGIALLGIERSVFTRTAFLKLSNLPMDEDDALRSRLNALVTTGDESGQADALAGKLKTLKNRCKHNKTGLLPEAETARAQLVSNLEKLDSLSQQAEQIRQQQTQTKARRDELHNHLAHLEYAAAARQIEKYESAKAACAAAEAAYGEMQQRCAALPTWEQAQTALNRVRDLRDRQDAAAQEDRQLPQISQAPQFPAPFTGLSGEMMAQMATADQNAYHDLQNKGKTNPKDYVPMALGLCAVLLALIPHWIGYALAAVGVLAGAALFANQRICRTKNREAAIALAGKYAPHSPDTWVDLAKTYAGELETYQQHTAAAQAKREESDRRHKELSQQIARFCGGTTLSLCQEQWENVQKQHQQLEQARLAFDRAKELVAAMDNGNAPVSAPAFPDTLSYTKEQTAAYITDVTALLQRLQTNLDQSLGQMETYGTREQLQKKIAEADKNIESLEDTYAALTIAQQTLADAATALQRRFAPRISQRARDIFSDLTGNRYDRLFLESDLSVSVGAQGEDTLHKSAWRSDGTVDQMYLALRLAVAGELSPEAPMILDDALVRFDDTRLASAMKILQAQAENKQIILFTCQDRENKILQQ